MLTALMKRKLLDLMKFNRCIRFTIFQIFRTGNSNNRWGGRAVTMIDSLDTLWLMEMKDEFYRARDWIRDHLRYDQNDFVSFFETVIRDLGGLLSAYHLSKDDVFLEKATDLGQRLFKNLKQNNVPVGTVNLATGATRANSWTPSQALLAEVGTCQLEFVSLGHLIGDENLKQLPLSVMSLVVENTAVDGLLPTFLSTNLHSNTQQNKLLTMGAMGDSFYEYLLKVWIHSDHEQSKFKSWFDESVSGIRHHLFTRTHPNDLLMLVDDHNGMKNEKMDHLACFLAGSLALNYLHDPDKTEDLKLAKQLMYTCVQTYEKQPTGLGPENIQKNDGSDFVAGVKHHLLRPEVVESLFVLHQVTNDPIYRVWGHRMMRNIEKHCKTRYGYGHYGDVTNLNAGPMDSMESYFLAETLKYHYLLQESEVLIDLKEWVFNTEAHPFPIIRA